MGHITLHRFSSLLLSLMLLAGVSLQAAAQSVDLEVDFQNRMGYYRLQGTLTIDTTLDTQAHVVWNGGNIVGSHQFHAYTSGPATGYEILVVHIEQNPACPPLTYEKIDLLYFVDPTRTSFYFIGGTNFVGQMGIPVLLDRYYWQALGKLMVAPLSMTIDDFKDLNYLTYYGYTENDDSYTKGVSLASMMYPRCVLHLLDSLAASPNFSYGFDLLGWWSIGSFDDTQVLAKDRAEIYSKLKSVWGLMSDSTKESFLKRSIGGNGEALGILTELLKGHIDEKRPLLSASDFSNFYRSVVFAFGASIHSVPGLASGDPGVALAKEQALFQTILSDCRQNSHLTRSPNANHALKFITQRLVIERYHRPDGLYNADVQAYVDKLLNGNYGLLDRDAKQMLLVNLQDFVPTAFYTSTQLESALDADVLQLVTLAASDPSTSTYHDTYRFLISLMNAPLPATLKSEIFTALEQSPIPSYPYYPVGENWRLNLTLTQQTALFTKVRADMDAKLSARNMADDTYGQTFEIYLASWLVVMKNSGHFHDLAPLFSSLIPTLNPAHASETGPQYTNRLARLEDLWETHGLLIMDLSGGMAAGPMALGQGATSYADVFENMMEHHFKWINLLVMSSSGSSASGKRGAFEFNWTASHYDSPAEIGSVFIHEVFHSYQLAYSDNAEMDKIFYRQHFLNHDYMGTPHYDRKPYQYESHVSAYSRSNELEYSAEIYRYWAVDSLAWLRYALRMFHEGNPSLLQQFVYMNQVSLSSPAESLTTFKLYKLDNATGFLSKTDCNAFWESGSPVNGRFVIDAPDGRITLDFDIGRIVAAHDYSDWDGDDLPDWWELAYGLDLEDDGSGNVNEGPNGVLSADGLTTYQKYLYGMDPNKPVPAGYQPLRMTGNVADGFTLRFDAWLNGNVLYDMEVSEDLKTWGSLSDRVDIPHTEDFDPHPTQADFGEVIITIDDPSNWPSLFFRGSATAQ